MGFGSGLGLELARAVVHGRAFGVELEDHVRRVHADPLGRVRWLGLGLGLGQPNPNPNLNPNPHPHHG